MMGFYLRRLLAVVVSLTALATLPGQAAAATIKVTPQFSGPADKCTIADAFLTAQSGSPVGHCEIEDDGGGPVIELEAETYVLAPGIPGFDESATAFTITVAMTIQGKVLADGSRTIIKRDPNSTAFRLFRVQSNVTFRRLTLSGGDAGTNCCGARQPGGAIYAEGLGTHVTIDDVIFENNTAGHGGAISDANALYSNVTFAIGGSTFRNNRASLGGAIAVSQSGALTIATSQFDNNHTDDSGGAIYARPNRGAQIEIRDSGFLGNHAGQVGGAINAFDMTLWRVTMRGNSAESGGGAVYSAEGLATIIDSTFAGNQSNRGGAVYASDQLMVSGSTFTENSAAGQDGGAIFLRDGAGISRITNSTLSYNHAFVEGTAISTQSGELTLINDTIVGNTTAGSWGPAVRGYWNSPTIRISNSIIAENITFGGFPLDVYADERPGAVISLGHNLIGSADYTANAFTQVGDLAGDSANPLEPGLQRGADGKFLLAANGGPTDTHALLPSSLALNAGSPIPPGTDDACLAVDQRGMHRPGAGAPRCDIGAFEHQVTFVLTLNVSAGGSVIGIGNTACTGACTGNFDSGRMVWLIAQPPGDYTFAGWSGACTGTSPNCFVTMDGAKSVTATFNPPASVLTATKTVLTSSPNPSVFNKTVTITATVSAVAPGVDPPHSGTVGFFDGDTDALLGLGVIGLDPRVVISTHALSLGAHTIIAKYLGDPDHDASRAELAHFVSSGETGTSVWSSATPSMSRDEVTFTVAVVTRDPGLPMATGTVQFRNATTGTTIGFRTLDALGMASLKTFLPPGLNAIVAVYQGDNLLRASQGGWDQMVNVPAPKTLGISERVIVTDHVGLAPQTNTPTGTNVQVPSSGNPVTLTFAQITAPGFTNVERIIGGVTPPIGFLMTSPPALFEISTSARFVGAITVCIGYPTGSVSPRLMHYENGTWFDRTVSTNTTTRTVCASVTSLSPFGVFVPNGVEGRMKGDGAIAGDHEFDFRVAQRSSGVERGALTYKHKTPKAGKEKARTDQFKATAIGSVVFWDDPGFRPSRRRRPLVDSVQVIGSGTWNGAPGYTFEVEATDEGEPGRGRDTFSIVIRDPRGATVLSTEGVLTNGNIQSQRSLKR